MLDHKIHAVLNYLSLRALRTDAVDLAVRGEFIGVQLPIGVNLARMVVR